MSVLGEGFTREYLKWLMTGSTAVLAAGCRNGDHELVGYAIVTREHSIPAFLKSKFAFVVTYVCMHPATLIHGGVFRRALRIAIAAIANRRSRSAVSSAKASSARLIAIGVSPEYRRMGIGSQLLDYCEAQLRQQGCAQMGLVVDADNSAAIQLYESKHWAKVMRRGAWDGDMVKIL